MRTLLELKQDMGKVVNGLDTLHRDGATRSVQMASMSTRISNLELSSAKQRGIITGAMTVASALGAFFGVVAKMAYEYMSAKFHG